MRIQIVGKSIEELQEQLNYLTREREELKSRRKLLTYRITIQSSQIGRLKDAIYYRNHSDYSGEFYRSNNETYKKYGKTFKEFSQEEKREYWRNYNKKRKKLK